MKNRNLYLENPILKNRFYFFFLILRDGMKYLVYFSIKYTHLANQQHYWQEENSLVIHIMMII